MAKRFIDANKLESKFRITKIIEVFPEWESLSFQTKCKLVQYGKTIKMFVQDAPTVDAVEVVHGRWEEHDRSGIKVKGFMVCSVCNVMIPTADDNHYCLPRLNYCPNCGAKMDGDGNG